jgi:2-polyprenyl-3-methyl-5-hydroxy-6-metoxy-1,4-benzoquinol methylase
MSSSDIIISTCPTCGSSQWNNYLACKDYTVSQETFTLKTCRTCSLVVTSPRPSNDNLGKYYLSDDYISHTDKPASLIDRIYIFARSFALKWKIKLITRELQGNKNLLDYGCGTGNFLEAAHQSGWTITGIEPSPIARLAAQRNTGSTIAESLNELKDKKFSTITLWHVLEHVPDLNETLLKLKSLLEENGTLFIAVPNHASHDAQRYKSIWAGYDVPRHLWHFTPDNMQKLVSKHGLKLKRTVPMKLDAYYVSMLSEKYKNNQKLGPIQMIHAFFAGWRSNARAYAGTGNFSSLIYILTK